MKIIIKTKALYIMALCMIVSSCSFFEVDETIDPNAPPEAAFVSNATRLQIDQLAIGVFGAMRGGFADYYRITGSLGREVYVLASNESRWYTELLGTDGEIDNANFLNAYFTAFFSTVRRALVFEQSAVASTFLTNAEKEGARGFANTVKAFGMLHALNMQGESGIRISLEDIRNPGPIVSRTEALAEIRRLLDVGNTQLAAAGTAFAFPIPAGFSAFNTPATFIRFNRALAVRVALYQEDWAGVLSIIPTTYMNLTGSLTAGPTFTYGNPPDVNNPLFQVVNSTQATLVVVHPSFETAFAAGDSRASKIRRRTSPRSLGGLNGVFEPALYAANTSPIPILKNEELILMYAEALIQTGSAQNLTDAVAAIDIIRTGVGLAPYSGAIEQSALIDEVLEQRKFSMWYEGHRWIDMRRYNRLATLPLDLDSHVMFDRMPVPFAEVQWDIANP
jgi:starch-binding outer membrane protein, SusD/RagB family